jgi:hypothetical protein
MPRDRGNVVHQQRKAERGHGKDGAGLYPPAIAESQDGGLLPRAPTHGRVANPAMSRRRASTDPLSRFVRDGRSEAVRQHLVLLAPGPGASVAKAFAQPQHGLEALDGATRRVERPEVANPRHILLRREVAAFDPLLQVFDDVVDGCARQQARVPAGYDGRRVEARRFRTDPVRRE